MDFGSLSAQKFGLKKMEYLSSNFDTISLLFLVKFIVGLAGVNFLETTIIIGILLIIIYIGALAVLMLFVSMLLENSIMENDSYESKGVRKYKGLIGGISLLAAIYLFLRNTNIYYEDMFWGNQSIYKTYGFIDIVNYFVSLKIYSVLIMIILLVGCIAVISIGLKNRSINTFKKSFILPVLLMIPEEMIEVFILCLVILINICPFILVFYFLQTYKKVKFSLYVGLLGYAIYRLIYRPFNPLVIVAILYCIKRFLSFFLKDMNRECLFNKKIFTLRARLCIYSYMQLRILCKYGSLARKYDIIVCTCLVFYHVFINRIDLPFFIAAFLMGYRVYVDCLMVMLEQLNNLVLSTEIRQYYNLTVHEISIVSQLYDEHPELETVQAWLDQFRKISPVSLAVVPFSSNTASKVVKEVTKDSAHVPPSSVSSVKNVVEHSSHVVSPASSSVHSSANNVSRVSSSTESENSTFRERIQFKNITEEAKNAGFVKPEPELEPEPKPISIIERFREITSNVKDTMADVIKSPSFQAGAIGVTASVAANGITQTVAPGLSPADVTEIVNVTVQASQQVIQENIGEAKEFIQERIEETKEFFQQKIEAGQRASNQKIDEVTKQLEEFKNTVGTELKDTKEELNVTKEERDEAREERDEAREERDEAREERDRAQARAEYYKEEYDKLVQKSSIYGDETEVD